MASAVGNQEKLRRETKEYGHKSDIDLITKISSTRGVLAFMIALKLKKFFYHFMLFGFQVTKTKN